MPANEIGKMILDTLGVMAIGVSGVFAVLAVFYGAIKLMMARGDGDE